MRPTTKPRLLFQIVVLFALYHVIWCTAAGHQDPNTNGKRKIYINLLLFYDKFLLKRFNGNTEAVHEYILANTYSAALLYNDRPLNQVAQFFFVVQRLELLDEEVYNGLTSSQDGNVYRAKMHSHYYSRIQTPYTASILFTYLNFLYGSNRTETQGLAHPGTACRDNRDRAIIVEARSYRTAFIIAHEVGHSLGLPHDEELHCGNKFIMSATVGPGKNKFSGCSRDRLKSRFDELFKDANSDVVKCFQYPGPESAIAIFPNDQYHPYKSISATQQCQVALGDSFTVPDSQYSSVNICLDLPCTNGIIQVRLHPAIPNTPCGHNKYCREGKCR